MPQCAQQQCVPSSRLTARRGLEIKMPFAPKRRLIVTMNLLTIPGADSTQKNAVVMALGVLLCNSKKSVGMVLPFRLGQYTRNLIP